MLTPETSVIVDGLYRGQIVAAHPAGDYLVRLLRTALDANCEPLDVPALWDGESRAAATGEPLLATACDY